MWATCQRGSDVFSREHLGKSLAGAYKSPPSVIEKDTLEFFSYLHERALVSRGNSVRARAETQ